MRLFELDPNNPVDKELARTSQKAQDAGSLDPADQDPMGGEDPAMDDPMGGVGMGDDPMNAPEGPMGAEPEMDPPEDETPETPVDSALMSLMQGHDYMQRYDHSDVGASSNPVNIMAKDVDELSQIRNAIRIKVDQNGVADRVGRYNDPETKAANDMLAFVDQVLVHKKRAAKDTNTSTKDAPRVRKQPKPKTESGKKFKAKRY